MATQKFNFKTALFDADDKPQLEDGKPVLLSDILSNLIMRSNVSVETMKYFNWALELKQSGDIIMDDEERQKLMGFVDGNPHLQVLVKGRILQILG